MLALVLLGFCAWLVARVYESSSASSLLSRAWRRWTSRNVPTRAVMFLLVVCATMVGGSKGPSPLAGLYRTLLWHGSDVWPLLPSAQDNAASFANISSSQSSVHSATTTASSVTGYVGTNHVVTLSFDWPSPSRLPAHDRQNVLARTVWVSPTNIAGRLYEDHYLAFSESATTNPAVILIEYARKLDDGSVERCSSRTVTNSFPATVPIALQSGVHTCYWFRCEVPEAFTNCCLRDWNGEALFGSPEDSGKGFDLLGTLVIDDGGDVWVGATTNIVLGGVTNAVRNGVVLEGQP